MIRGGYVHHSRPGAKGVGCRLSCPPPLGTSNGRQNPENLDIKSRQIADTLNTFRMKSGNFLAYFNFSRQSCLLHHLTVGKVVCYPPPPSLSAPSVGPAPFMTLTSVIFLLLETDVIYCFIARFYEHPGHSDGFSEKLCF